MDDSWKYYWLAIPLLGLVSLFVYLLIYRKTPFDPSMFGLITLISAMFFVLVVKPTKFSFGGASYELQKEIEKIEKKIRRIAIFENGQIKFSTFEPNEIEIEIVPPKDPNRVPYDALVFLKRIPSHIEVRSPNVGAFSQHPMGTDEFGNRRKLGWIGFRFSPESSGTELTSVTVEAYFN